MKEKVNGVEGEGLEKLVLYQNIEDEKSKQEHRNQNIQIVNIVDEESIKEFIEKIDKTEISWRAYPRGLQNYMIYN